MIMSLPAALLASALAAATPAFPQEAEPPAAQAQSGPSDIVVAGRANREQEIRDFVTALSPAPITGQLARFEDELCPGAYGLAAPAKAAVEARMRRVAAAVGLRVAGPGCRANLLLMVTRDKRALITSLARRNPQFFGREQANDARWLAAQPGPVAAWQAELLLGADGHPAGRDLDETHDYIATRRPGMASHITAGSRPTFVASAVVVESGALLGLTTTQLADYALMRGLARTDPRLLTAESPASILTAIEAPMGSAVPITITRWDLGFLRGLYASRANLRVTQQRGEIRQRVGQDLARAEN